MANLKIKRRKDGYELAVLARRGKSKITPVRSTFVPTHDLAIVAVTAAEMLQGYYDSRDSRRS